VLGRPTVRISTENREITCQLSVYLVELRGDMEKLGLTNSYAASPL
jgi:hypothetical protein